MRLILLILLIVSLNKSFSETLDELVEIAKKNNPDIQRIEKELNILKYKYKSAGKLPNPTFSFSIKDSGGFTVFQYIPWYEKLSLQKEIEERRYEIQNILFVQEKNRVVRQIRETALLIWFNREKIRINNEFIEIIDTLTGRKNINISDINRLKILRTNLEVQNQDLELSINKLISELRILVNYNFENLSVNVEDIPSINEEDIRKKAGHASLLVRQINKQIERDNLSYKLAKEIYMPDFGISISYKTKDRFQDAFSLGVNFYVNVPIWKRLNQEQIVLEQKLQTIASQERKINVINQTIWSVEKLIAEYQTSIKNLAKLRSVQEVYKSDLESTIKNFIQGKDSINNVIFSLLESINYQNRINYEILSANLTYLKVMEIFGEL